MLIDFSFSNFRSFRDEQSFSMIREKRFMESDESLHSPIAAIYGANASGKSNFLKALRAMRNMVVNSYSQGDASSPIPREPFSVTKGSFLAFVHVLPCIHRERWTEIPVLVPL